MPSRYYYKVDLPDLLQFPEASEIIVEAANSETLKRFLDAHLPGCGFRQLPPNGRRVADVILSDDGRLLTGKLRCEGCRRYPVPVSTVHMHAGNFTTRAEKLLCDTCIVSESLRTCPACSAAGASSKRSRPCGAPVDDSSSSRRWERIEGSLSRIRKLAHA